MFNTALRSALKRSAGLLTVSHAFLYLRSKGKEVHELDRAFKAIVALQPNCILDLLFGKERKIVLKEITDPQVNLPELRGDKALVVEESGEERYLLLEAMVHPEPEKLATFALKALGIQYMQQRTTVVVIVYLEKGRYASFPPALKTAPVVLRITIN